MPEFYIEAIDGPEIGDGVGACGTAAYIRQRVIPIGRRELDFALAGPSPSYLPPLSSLPSE